MPICALLARSWAAIALNSAAPSSGLVKGDRDRPVLAAAATGARLDTTCSLIPGVAVKLLRVAWGDLPFQQLA